MTVMTSKPLGQILKSLDLVSEFDVQEALQVQKKKGGAIGKILMDQGHITELQLTQAMGMQSGMEMVDLDSLDIPVAAVFRDTQNYIRSAESGLGLHELIRVDVVRDLVQWRRLIAWIEDCASGNSVLPVRDPVGTVVTRQPNQLRLEPSGG